MLDEQNLSLRDVAEQLQRDIYVGKLKPGMKLKQIDLERRYGSSRIVLRQALDQLVAKGMIRHEQNRGYRVEVFDGEKIRQLTETRAVLEMATVETLLPYVTDDYLRNLEERAMNFRAIYHGADVYASDDANRSFHQALLAPCPNRVMVDLIFELRSRLPMGISTRINTPDRVERLMQDHFDMVDALRERDVVRLRKLFWEHITFEAGASQNRQSA